MATLGADVKRDFESEPALSINDLPVIASDIIYEGAAVGDNASGYCRPLVSGDPFRGWAARRVDNASGAAGAKAVTLRQEALVRLTVTGASAVTDVGKPVFATDDDTFTLTPGGSRIGVVARWVSSTTCIVASQAEQVSQVEYVELTDPGSGGAIPIYWGGAKRAYLSIVTAGAEARSVADPTVAGLDLTLCLKTDGGDATVTFASDITQTSGENVATFGDAGDTINVRSVAIGSAFKWRLVGATATQQGVALT
jgi:hypothetical protein